MKAGTFAERPVEEQVGLGRFKGARMVHSEVSETRSEMIGLCGAGALQCHQRLRNAESQV